MDSLHKLSKCWASSTIPRDVWLHICLYLSVESLYMLRATCRAMLDIIDSRIVWLSAINDLSSINPPIYSVQDINDMTALQLREASCQMIQVHRAFSCPKLPHREIKLLTHDEMSPDYTQALLFPGGEQLLILSKAGSFDIYDIFLRKLVMHIPSLRPEWHDASSRAEVFPISAHVGYIVIEVTHPSVPPSDFEELRVYKYLEIPLKIEFILTEERPLTDFFRQYTFDYRQGLLTLAQLLQPDPDNLTTVNLILRTIDSKGGDTRTIQKLFLDLPFDAATQPEQGDLFLPPVIQILSPQFFLLRFNRYFLVFDTSQFDAREAHGDVKIRPIWKSGEGIYHPSSGLCSMYTIPYLTDGRKPFIRVISWERNPGDICVFKLHTTDVPSHITASGGISSSSTSLKTFESFGEGEHGDFMLSQTAHHGGVNLGVVWLNSYTMRQTRGGLMPSLPLDREGLWTYTIINTHGCDTDDAGVLRLATETHLFQTNLGNTRQPWRAASQDVEVKCISIDGVSGRFVQFKPAFRCAGGPSTEEVQVETAGIVLFAFDLAAVDSVPTATQVMRTSAT